MKTKTIELKMTVPGAKEIAAILEQAADEVAGLNQHIRAMVQRVDTFGDDSKMIMKAAATVEKAAEMLRVERANTGDPTRDLRQWMALQQSLLDQINARLERLEAK